MCSSAIVGVSPRYFILVFFQSGLQGPIPVYVSMYVSPHSDGTLYTTPLTCSIRGLPFSLVRRLLSVCWLRILSWSHWHIGWTCSLTPFIHGRQSVFNCSCGWCVSCSLLWSLFLSTHWVRFLGYPFWTKTSSRCLISSVRDASSHTFPHDLVHMRWYLSQSGGGG